MELDLQADVGVALVRTAFTLRRVIQERLRTAGAEVTVAEFGLLAFIAQEENRRVGEVAAFVSLDRTTVTRLSDGLVKKGLVSRREDEEDRRAVLLCATPRGRRLLARLLPLRQKVLDRATSGLSNKRRSDLIKVLAEMRAGLLEQMGATR